MKAITIIISAWIFCAITSIYAEAKTDHSQCGVSCRQSNCSGGMSRLLYCGSECQRKCVRQEDHEGNHSKKQH
jgi:hypothetical protein